MLFSVTVIVVVIGPQCAAAFRSKPDEPETHHVSACLTDPIITVQCKPDQKIKILSAAYAYEETCGTLAESNECTQIRCDIPLAYLISLLRLQFQTSNLGE